MKRALLWLSPIIFLAACNNEQRNAFLLKHQSELEKGDAIRFVVECKVTEAGQRALCETTDTLFFNHTKSPLRSLEPVRAPKTLDLRDPGFKVGERYLVYGILHPFSKCPVQIVDFVGLDSSNQRGISNKRGSEVRFCGPKVS